MAILFIVDLPVGENLSHLTYSRLSKARMCSPASPVHFPQLETFNVNAFEGTNLDLCEHMSAFSLNTAVPRKQVAEGRRMNREAQNEAHLKREGVLPMQLLSGPFIGG